MAKKRRQNYRPKQSSRIGLLWASQETYDAAMKRIGNDQDAALAELVKMSLPATEPLTMDAIKEEDYVPE